MFFLLQFPIYIISIWPFTVFSYSNSNIFIHIHNFPITVVKINNFLSSTLNYRLKLYKTISTKCVKSICLIQKSNKKQRNQKGLGKARVGTLKSSISKGGGVIFGPRPHHVKLKLNIKEWVCLYKSFLINKRCCIIWIFINKIIRYYKKENFLQNLLFHLGISLSERIIFSILNKHFLYKQNFIKNIRFNNINLINFFNSKYIIYLI